MKNRVLKFGGSTFKNANDYQRIANFLKEESRFEKLVVVVSAGTGETEQLRAKSLKVSPEPSTESTDSLITMADSVSAVLLKIALEAVGVKARSLLNFQNGIITDNTFSAAKVEYLEPSQLEENLKSQEVLVVAGGQAVTADWRPSWLGKNSSDYTAILMAKMLGLNKVEVFSDVEGVYSADPNIFSETELQSEIGYEDAIAISRAGAKVIHHTSVSEAQNSGISIVCRLNKAPFTVGTIIGKDAPFVNVVFDQRAKVYKISKDTTALKLENVIDRLKANTGNPAHIISEKNETYLAVTCGFSNPEKELVGEGVVFEETEMAMLSFFDSKKAEIHLGMPEELRSIGQERLALLTMGVSS